MMYLTLLVAVFLCIGTPTDAYRRHKKKNRAPPPPASDPLFSPMRRPGGKDSGPIGDDDHQMHKLNANVLDVITNTVNKNDITTFSVGDKNKKEIDKGLFEGDIMMSQDLQAQIDAWKEGKGKFDAITKGQWPNGVIPWTYQGQEHLQIGNQVNAAIKAIRDATGGCLKWSYYRRDQLRNTKNYVMIFRGGGCFSMIGMQRSGRQQLSIGYGCQYKGIIMHEMMHAMGFFHEQSRRDRDNYITINWGYINPAMRYNFQKYRPEQASTLGYGYDKKSIMHYGSYAFTTQRGQKTIVSKSNPNEKLGQREGLSEIDIKQLMKYYKCPKTGTGTGGGNRDKDGGWAGWKVATSCSKKCGGGEKKLRRTCSNPSPAGNGKQCLKSDRRTRSMSEYKTERCNTQRCSSACTDGYVFCTKLSSYCRSSNSKAKDWVNRYCKKTCRKCPTTPSSSCKNLGGGSCVSWKNSGYCKKRYVAYMKTNCNKACGYCR